MRDLLRGKKRYSQFLASAEHIPTNILADRLKRLEREGLITSAAYSEHPRRLEYHLTDEGRALASAVARLPRGASSTSRAPSRPAPLTPTSDRLISSGPDGSATLRHLIE